MEHGPNALILLCGSPSGSIVMPSMFGASQHTQPEQLCRYWVQRRSAPRRWTASAPGGPSPGAPRRAPSGRTPPAPRPAVDRRSRHMLHAVRAGEDQTQHRQQRATFAQCSGRCRHLYGMIRRWQRQNHLQAGEAGPRDLEVAAAHAGVEVDVQRRVLHRAPQRRQLQLIQRQPRHLAVHLAGAAVHLQMIAHWKACPALKQLHMRMGHS